MITGDDIKKLVYNLNKEKKHLKQSDISVDGKRYKVSFKGKTQ